MLIPQLIEFRNSLKYDLPLVFEDINLIPKKYRPNCFDEIERHFTDIDGQSYMKISKATKALIDKTDSSIPPIGPYVSADGKIEWAKNISLDALQNRLSELPKDKEIIIHCGSGMRAQMAHSVLKNAGYQSRFLDDRVTFIDKRTICCFKE